MPTIIICTQIIMFNNYVELGSLYAALGLYAHVYSDISSDIIICNHIITYNYILYNIILQS